MALMTRISRLFVADVNAILDQLEEPAAQLRQAVREMDDEIGQAELELRELARVHSATDDQLEQLGEQLDSANEKVALAMDAADATLAHDMLRRRLTLEQRASQLRDQQLRNRKQQAVVSERLAAWRGKLDAVVQKLSILESTAVTAGTPESADHVSEQDVQVAYLAELKKRQSS